MKIKLDHGVLQIAGDVFTAISGYAATNCFGVKGMASRSVQDGLVRLLKRDSLSKGVKITYPPGGDSIGVHLRIVVEHGVNIPAVCRSIMSEVRYHVEKATGVRVQAVNVYIDSIMTT